VTGGGGNLQGGGLLQGSCAKSSSQMKVVRKKLIGRPLEKVRRREHYLGSPSDAGLSHEEELIWLGSAEGNRLQSGGR